MGSSTQGGGGLPPPKDRGHRGWKALPGLPKRSLAVPAFLTVGELSAGGMCWLGSPSDNSFPGLRSRLAPELRDPGGGGVPGTLPFLGVPAPPPTPRLPRRRRRGRPRRHVAPARPRVPSPRPSSPRLPPPPASPRPPPPAEVRPRLRRCGRSCSALSRALPGTRTLAKTRSGDRHRVSDRRPQPVTPTDLEAGGEWSLAAPGDPRRRLATCSSARARDSRLRSD